MKKLKLVERKQEPKYLLDGKPYVPAAKTDILKTFAKFGWIPPSQKS